MKKTGQHTYHEITSQPGAWAQALEVTGSQRALILRLWDQYQQPAVLFTGCGSTYYLSLAAASLFSGLTSHQARAVPAGELVLYPHNNYAKDAPVMLVAISRSGTTTETVVAARQFKDMGRGPVVVITNYEDAPLSTVGDLVIGIPSGQERSVAQTRSFASMFVAATTFAAQVAGRNDLLDAMQELPPLGDRLMRKYEELARSIGENMNLDRFYFLGSGPRYGLACETNLKMKEMTLTHSEPFHFFEFRHGPMSMVGETAAVIGLRSSANARHEGAVLDEMKALGAAVISLGEQDADVAFESRLPEAVRDVLYLPVLQLMAYYRSIAKELDPDQPKNLNAVVELTLDD